MIKSKLITILLPCCLCIFNLVEGFCQEDNYFLKENPSLGISLSPIISHYKFDGLNFNQSKVDYKRNLSYSSQIICTLPLLRNRLYSTINMGIIDRKLDYDLTPFQTNKVKEVNLNLFNFTSSFGVKYMYFNWFVNFAAIYEQNISVKSFTNGNRDINPRSIDFRKNQLGFRPMVGYEKPISKNLGLAISSNIDIFSSNIMSYGVMIILFYKKNL